MIRFVEGRNCWKISKASRSAFLVDGDAYYRALAASLLKARKTILISSWELHSEVWLTCYEKNGVPKCKFSELLLNILHENPELEVFILLWDPAIMYAFERQSKSELAQFVTRHERIHLVYDKFHPPGTSQHQKLVIVDGQVAFCGGLDITHRRWDTPEHKAHDDRRVDPYGKSYHPFHDVQLIVEGPVAKDLVELFSCRWRNATGQEFVFRTESHDCWPNYLEPELKDTDIAIARTLPAYKNQTEVREIEQLFIDSIYSAEKAIFIESQYLTCEAISKALQDRLSEPRGPEIVILTPYKNSGWIEESFMGTIRYRLINDLRIADSFGRLKIYYPSRLDKTVVPVNLHSKVFVADDFLARVGSANLSNRSMGADTECDLALLARSEIDRKAILKFRNRLLAEHLEVTPELFESTLIRMGSLIATIEFFRKPGSGLNDFPNGPSLIKDILVPRSDLIDPPKPYSLIGLDNMYGSITSPKGGLILLLISFIIVALAGTLWRLTPLEEYVDPERLAALVNQIKTEPLKSIVVILGFSILASLMFPLLALIVAVGFSFEAVVAFIYCMIGSMLSASLVYWLGKKGFKRRQELFTNPKARKIAQALTQKGVFIVFLVRLLPLAPFTFVNLVMGAVRIRFFDYFWGTVFGLLPGLLTMALFGNRIRFAIENPTAMSFIVLALLILVFFTLQKVIDRIIKKQGLTKNMNS